MKVIIIEGPDNCGKNTLIQNIIDNNDVVKVIHCHKPDKNVSDPFKAMSDIYFMHADKIIADNMNGHCDVILFNRYYPSEYIYGQLYRNGSQQKIEDMITALESYLKSHISAKNLYYVQLNSTSVKLLVNNEDGKSLSQGKADQIKKELDLFQEVFDYSTLNKKMIYINKGSKFKSKKDILNEFNDFIK